MKRLLPKFAAMMMWVALVFAMPAVAGAAAMGPYEDVPLGTLPPDAVKTVVQKTLSPQGRFVILSASGTVRIFDTPQKVAEVRAALDTLRNAPANIAVAVSIKTGMRHVTQVSTAVPDTGGYEIPIPYSYSPPQIIRGGRGPIIIPSQPGNFRTYPPGYAGGGGYVPYQGGYVTSTIVQQKQTSIEGGVVRKFSATTLSPKPVSMAINPKVSDPAALHDWAVKAGVVPANEPAWAAASTDILVTPESAENGVGLNLMPRIQATGADGKPRIIPLKACAASVVIEKGIPATFEEFPGTDAEFYRVFVGAPESAGDVMSSISVGAAVQYIPQPATQPDVPAQSAQPAAAQ